jgi:hypothetical protein
MTFGSLARITHRLNVFLIMTRTTKLSQDSTNNRKWRMAYTIMPSWSRWLIDSKDLFIGASSWRPWWKRIKASFTSTLMQSFLCCSILYKKESWAKFKKILLSNASRWTESKFFEALGTCRILRRYKFDLWVCKVEWPMLLICISDPPAIWTWSFPRYLSRTVNLSSSLVMWSLAPLSAYQFVSTP